MPVVADQVCVRGSFSNYQQAWPNSNHGVVGQRRRHRRSRSTGASASALS